MSTNAKMLEQFNRGKRMMKASKEIRLGTIERQVRILEALGKAPVAK